MKPNLTYAQIQEVMVENIPNPVTKDFFDAYVEFMEDRSGLVKPHTIKKYKIILVILKEFRENERECLKIGTKIIAEATLKTQVNFRR